MSHTDRSTGWIPAIERNAGPIYVSIADALERDIRSGMLPPGVRLPAQRALGEAIGVDFTTVTRAYAEARRRGLIEGRTGQGTFVARPRSESATGAAQIPEVSSSVDMTMNLPPRFEAPDLLRRMWAEAVNCADPADGATGFDLLMQYHVPGGTAEDQAVGAEWLRARIPDLTARDVLVTAGAQGALHALFGALLEPGGRVLSPELTYPGMIAAAEHLRLTATGLPMDEDGLLPGPLESVARHSPGSVLYLNPTLQNPTTITMSVGRRREIVEIVRRHGLLIVEDDAYGALVPDAPPPFRALAPDLVFHVAGLAKCLSPSLRIAHLVLPDAGGRYRYDIERAIRATSSNASAIAAAIAARWIRSGSATEIVAAIRSETRLRHAIGQKILPEAFARHPSDAFHLWLPLPGGRDRLSFAAGLRSTGVGVVEADEFSLGATPNAVRLSLGSPKTSADLRVGLERVAEVLAQGDRPRPFVV